MCLLGCSDVVAVDADNVLHLESSVVNTVWFSAPEIACRSDFILMALT